MRHDAEFRVRDKQPEQFAGPAVGRAENGETEPGVASVAPGELDESPAWHLARDTSQRKRELVANAKIRIIGQFFEPGTDFRCGLERFGKPHGMLAHVGVGIVEPVQDRAGVQRLQAVQRIEGVHAAQGRFRPGRQLPERQDCRPVLPLIEQARGGVAMPAVGMIEQRHQIGGRDLAEPRRLGLLKTLGHDAVEPSLVKTGAEVQVLRDVWGHELGRLDQEAVHVDHVQRAVGAVGHLHRAKPHVGGSHELGARVGPQGSQADAVRHEAGAIDEIVGDLPHEQIAAVVRRPGVAAEDRDAAGSAEIAGRLVSFGWVRLLDARRPQARPHDTPRFVGADARNLGVIAARGDPGRGCRGFEIGIPREITTIVHDQEDRVVASADELAAPIVHAHAVLAAAAGHRERFGARVEEEALAAHRDRPRVLALGVADFAAAVASRQVDAVVEQPTERVEQGLAADVTAEASEDDPADVRLAVAVRVPGVQDVRDSADENAAVVATDSRGRVQVREEDGALVEAAVAVGVFQQAHAAAAEGLFARVLVEFGEFGDVQAAVFVEIERHRARQHWLGCNQLDAKVRVDSKRLQGLGRALRRDVW